MNFELVDAEDLKLLKFGFLYYNNYKFIFKVIITGICSICN
jgi:hypothetical protein